MESNPKGRPLDAIRNLNIWWKIPINLFLLFIFFTYGSYGGNERCMEAHDGECEYWRIMSANGVIPRMVGFYAAAISIIILALTSEWTQWVLATPPI
tara:strand:+ start:284 stop:574 length:291 start_codon:yes stop_codon:yes gene_type:complete